MTTRAALQTQIEATSAALDSLPECPATEPAREALSLTLDHLRFRCPGPTDAAEGSESRIQHDIQLALGCRDDLYLTRRNVGTARDPTTGRLVRFNTKGEGDLQFVLRVACSCGRTYGQAGALEVKSPTGRQARAQRLWEAAWTRRGGLYRVVRSVADAERALLEASGSPL